MNDKELIDLTKKVFHILFESETFDENEIERYFSWMASSSPITS